MLLDNGADERLRAALAAAHEVMEQNLALWRQAEIALIQAEADGCRQRARRGGHEVGMGAGDAGCATRRDAGGALVWFPTRPSVHLATPRASDAAQAHAGLEQLLWFPGVCPPVVTER